MNEEVEQTSTEESEYVLPPSQASKDAARDLAMYGTAWTGLIAAANELRRRGIVLTGVSVRGGWVGDVDLLVVLTADTPDGKKVAFHGAESILRLWERLRRRIVNDSLVWKDDLYG